MKPNIYYIFLRCFSAILAILAILLQIYALLEIELINTYFISIQTALALSIYISMILCLIHIDKTVKEIERYKNERKE